MTLQQFIDQALDDHAAEPRAVAARLDQGDALLAASPDRAEAFALEAVAHAQIAAGRAVQAAATRGQMAERLALIDDAGLRAYAEKQLAPIDAALR